MRVGDEVQTPQGPGKVIEIERFPDGSIASVAVDVYALGIPANVPVPWFMPEDVRS